MQFWCSAEVVSNSDDRVGQNSCKCSLVGSRRVDGNELSKDRIEESYTVLFIYFRPSFLFTYLAYVMVAILRYIKWFFCLLFLFFYYHYS